MDSSKEENPFRRLRIRSFLGWGLATLPAAFWALDRTAGDLRLNGTVYYALLYGVTLLWAGCQFEWSGIRASRLIGRLPANYYWLSPLALVILLMTFSIGAFDLLHYPLSYLAPQYVESVLNGEFQTWGDYRLILLTVGGAPLAEELFFRGILLHRWTVKWDIRRALLASSLAFALMHTDPIGAFVFGYAMAVLYIKSGTLWIPMACHSLNNALCVLWEYLEGGPGWSVAASSTLDQYRSESWTGALCLLIATPWVVRFMVRNWPKPDCLTPYLVNQEPLAEARPLPPPSPGLIMEITTATSGGMKAVCGFRRPTRSTALTRRRRRRRRIAYSGRP